MSEPAPQRKDQFGASRGRTGTSVGDCRHPDDGLILLAAAAAGAPDGKNCVARVHGSNPGRGRHGPLHAAKSKKYARVAAMIRDGGGEQRETATWYGRRRRNERGWRGSRRRGP